MNASEKLKMKIGILASIGVSLSYMAYSPVIADIQKAFPGTNISLIQMIMTVPSFMFILFSPLAGKLTRYVKKKTLVITALILYLIGGLFPFFFHQNIYLILAGSCVIGCGSGLISPVINALICDYFEGDERARLMGFNATAVAVGAMFFIFLSGQLISRFGWTYCFLSFLLVLVILIIALICLPEGKMPETEDEKSGSGFEMNPYIAFLFIIGFIYFAVQNAFNTNSSLVLEEIGIHGANYASMVTMGNTLGGIIGGMIFGFLVKKLKDQIQTLAFILSGAGFLAVFLFRTLVPVVISGVFVGSAFAFYNATGTFLLSKYLKPENNAFTVSVYLAVVNVGASLSPLFVNSVSGIFGETITLRYLICGIILAVCMVFSLVINQRHVNK